MNILYLLRDDGACGYYRLDLPLLTMGKNLKGKVKIERFREGESFKKLADSLEGADIVVMPRLCEDNFIMLFEQLKKDGKKIVIDHDDNMFCISPLSNHYAECGTENVEVVMKDGTKMKLWEDGKNINLKVNKKRIDNFKKALSMADMVTVTTDILADVYREYSDNVKVLPNCIDTKLWQKLPLQKNGGLRIGWFGGSSHFEDLNLIEDVLPLIIKKYPQVKLVIMGQLFKSLFKKIPEDRFEFHSWVPTPAYPYKSAIIDLDIALIPLRDNKFSSCKSAIKWIEMAALETPSVTSHVSPYKENMYDGNGVFIQDNDKDGWRKGISLLIENEQLRNEVGIKAKEYVYEHFDIHKKYPLWFETYKGVM